MPVRVQTPKLTICPDGRMRTDDAAAYLGVAAKTLAVWRNLGKGPRFLKIGRILTFYYRQDLDAWLQRYGEVWETADTSQVQTPAGER
jgi:Helix-turn-helix domain